ncbi:LysM peptidoglycan-binding domain-containing protein [Saccharibacillus sp. JS10]|uniref:LysM peptidoglycan-binding domain-containing protein n=1 Tax=Saccharibacillus sp. JS10 TaxID=2950552 RepID=UPI002108FBC7|nr:LysM peptidoglycan-binding domain-containing protein [Saccharibacillus sp. JS10]MCQ4086523.1 LysM peptidoglycan-binding domain-containing protein [Saccharibacillus sp. JS10]
MNKKIVTTMLALALTTGGAAAASHSYAASSTSNSSTTSSVNTAPAASTADQSPTLPSGKPTPGEHGPIGGPHAEREQIASLLKLTEEQLNTRLEAGESLAKIATAQGVTTQSVVDLLVSTHETHLKSELEAGTITQTQYNERLAEAKERAQDEVNRVFDGSMPGPGKGPKQEMKEIASLLKLTSEQLKTRQEAGESLADIAKAQGVSQQSLIDLLVSKHETRLKAELADGKITQTQYNERIADAREHEAERITHVFDPSKAPVPPVPGEGKGKGKGGKLPGAPREAHVGPAGDLPPAPKDVEVSPAPVDQVPQTTVTPQADTSGK